MSFQQSARGRVAPRLVLMASMAIFPGACSPSPDGRDADSVDGERVNGTERIGWSQAAAGVSDAESYDYVAYVDGQRTALQRASCQAGASSAFACSTRLPSLAPGRHVLELAAVHVVGGTPQEGPRSEPLVVFVDPYAQASLALTAVPEPGRSSQAAASETHCFQTDACYSVEVWSRQFVAAHSLAALPDHRSLLIEDGQRIWLAVPGDRLAEVEVAPSCSPDARLAALAVDPDFALNGRVYVAWRCPSEDGPALLRVSRYRELAGALGEGATVLEVQLLDARLPLMAVGGDRMLYVAVPGRSSWSLLRLTSDGSTPRSNPAASPVIAHLQNPVAIARVGAGIVVLSPGDRLTIFGEAPSSGGSTGLETRALGLPRSSGSLGTLAIDDSLAPEWWAFSAEAASETLHRLRLAPGAVVFEPQGNAAVRSCGILQELSLGPDGALWAVARIEPGLGSGWRLCRLEHE